MADRTKLWIAETMRKLMSKEPIDRIHVTDICKEAGIERPTFYYHFKDKYDLVAWIFCNDSVDLDVISVESAADSMNRMKQNALFYKHAYEDESQNSLWKYLLKYFTDSYSSVAKRKLGADVLDPQLQFSIKLYCYGAVGLTREWLLNDNITPADVEVKMMFNSMPDTMRKIYFTEEG